jgi:cyanide hydratase
MWRVNYQESLPLLKKYREASLPSDSPQMHRIRAAAKENSIFVSLGYSEVDLNSLYTTQVMIDPTGNIINHRRKIRATHVERLVFGDGTGDTTNMVMDTEIGRLGTCLYPTLAVWNQNRWGLRVSPPKFGDCDATPRATACLNDY